MEIINKARTAIQRAERCLLIPEFFGETKVYDNRITELGDNWQRVDQGLKL
jgi:hypothetical protein